MNRPTWKHQEGHWRDHASHLAVRALRPLRLWWRARHERLDVVEVRGVEPLRPLVGEGAGLLFTPNHSAHADPLCMYEVGDRLGTPLHFMVAAGVFASAPHPVRILLRWHGCFSVDREGTDLRAFRRATEILQKSPFPLVIFPEGEVYHLNDRITPFRDGPAVIALSAVKHARRPVLCVPVAIRYRYTVDPTPELHRLMTELEERLSWRPREDQPLHRRIVRYAEGQVALKELEYLGRITDGSIEERIARVRETILGRIEGRHGRSPAGLSVPERVKELRRICLAARGRAGITGEELRELDLQLEDLLVAVQLFSYPGDWLRGRPSLERVAETLDKLEEDVLALPSARIRGRRRAEVLLGDPLDVRAYASGNSRKAAPALTEQIEQRIQQMLDRSAAPQNV